MAEKIVAGPVSDLSGVREAVCVHAKKIYSSCRDKDCIEDLRFYPTPTAQAVLGASQSIRGGRAELLDVSIRVEPVHFNRGFFTVDLRFYYRVILQALNGSTRYAEVEGLSVFDKRVILFGSEGNAKVFSSDTSIDTQNAQVNFSANLPTAICEAVDPLLLCAKINDCSGGQFCDCGINGVPEAIASAFDEPLIFDDSQPRRVYITLGQFSIVRLERDTQLLMPIYDYCVPENECEIGGGCSTGEDPCEMFDSVDFPINEFFPPNSIAQNPNADNTQSFRK